MLDKAVKDADDSGSSALSPSPYLDDAGCSNEESWRQVGAKSPTITATNMTAQNAETSKRSGSRTLKQQRCNSINAPTTTLIKEVTSAMSSHARLMPDNNSYHQQQQRRHNSRFPSIFHFILLVATAITFLIFPMMSFSAPMFGRPPQDISRCF